MEVAQNGIQQSFLKRQLFNGRLSRANYILGLISLVLLLSVFLYVMLLFVFPAFDHRTYAQLQKDATDITHTIITFFIALPLPVLLIICHESLMIRRMHDLDKEVVWGTWNNWQSDLIIRKGTEGPNQYGEPQKGIGIRQILGI